MFNVLFYQQNPGLSLCSRPIKSPAEAGLGRSEETYMTPRALGSQSDSDGQ
jgi:hypothetical protein